MPCCLGLHALLAAGSLAGCGTGSWVQGRTGQNRAGPGARAGLGRACWGRTDEGRVGQGYAQHVRAGQIRAGQGQGTSGQGRAHQGLWRQDKLGQGRGQGSAKGTGRAPYAHFANSCGNRVAFVYPPMTLSKLLVPRPPYRGGWAPRGLPRSGQVLLFSPSATAVSVEVCWLKSGVMPVVPSVQQASRDERRAEGKMVEGPRLKGKLERQA